MDPSNPSVLVVEDDREINSLIGAYAEICGLNYRHAYNGAAALRSAAQTTPQVVVLDLMLPDIDGFEVCKQLRAKGETANTPIIILSALGGDEHRAKGKECGANVHLTKPFNPDEFTQVLTEQANSAANGNGKS